MPRPRLAAPAVAVGLALAACAPADEPAGPAGTTPGATSTSPGPATPTPEPCSPIALDTRMAGRLTIATSEPAYEPWMVDDDPTNGKGFESAVAYAVAEELGYGRDAVTWTRVPFDAAIQPGPKAFDFDVNQFSITEERRNAVDFSAPYYDVRQAVIALDDSPAADATSLADLKDVRFGAQVGTTSLQAIEEFVQPSRRPQVYNSNDDAKQALANGQVEALVVDLPTAFYLTSAEIDDSSVVGQLPQPQGEVEQFGLVLDKGSPLTDCVRRAVESLRADGTLDTLEQRWLADVAGAPELT